MGFFDKIKGAVNAVTGGGAKVTLDFDQAVVCAGEAIKVKISATSTGAEVKSQGVFVDLQGTEEVTVRPSDITPQAGTPQAPAITSNITVSKKSLQQSFQIAPAFVLAPNETKLFEGTVQLPASVLPTFAGQLTKHHWQIQGRIEATGNDPDSGFKPIRIGWKG